MPPELRIHEVVDQPGLELFERTLVDGYPMPDLLPYRWGRFFDLAAAVTMPMEYRSTSSSCG